MRNGHFQGAKILDPLSGTAVPAKNFRRPSMVIFSAENRLNQQSLVYLNTMALLFRITISGGFNTTTSNANPEILTQKRRPDQG